MWQVDSSLCLPLRVLPLPTVCWLRVLAVEQCITESDFYSARWKLISGAGTLLLTWTFNARLTHDNVSQAVGKAQQFRFFFLAESSEVAGKKIVIFIPSHLLYFNSVRQALAGTKKCQNNKWKEKAPNHYAKVHYYWDNDFPTTTIIQWANFQYMN